MKREDRAKQFMPFSALKGYNEALQEKENMKEPRRVLGEDEAEMIDRKLRFIAVGDEVRINHYFRRRYVASTGIVAEIRNQEHIIVLGSIKIRFEDILDIEII